MRTNIEIDDKLMGAVMKSGAFPTKRAAVEEGLRILRMRIAGQRLLALRGKIAWEGDLDAWRRSKIQPPPFEVEPTRAKTIARKPKRKVAA